VSLAASAVAPPFGATAPVADSLAPTQPAPATGESAAPASGYGVDLQQTIEAVHATIELASRQGLSQARIALEPEGLGAIRIHLSQSASGLVARLTADSSAGAQALSEGRAELRSSLASLGLSAMHLDTSAFQSGTHGQAHQPAPRSLDHGLGRRAAQTGEGEGDDTDSDTDTQLPDSSSGTPRSSRGALVDVLA
jgi:flagellar hook-length control protein FliK